MKKTQSKIKSGAFERSMTMAGLSIRAGVKAAGHAVETLFASKENKQEKMKNLLKEQVKLLTEELGELKGSLMKVGQSLSLVGEHFLPKEINTFLKSLQQNAPPLAWRLIEKELKKELGDKLNELVICTESIGTASLGQVHRARVRSTGQDVVLKVQYPGVAESIDGDLKTLKHIFRIGKILPVTEKLDLLFEEVRIMLHREVDYVKEKEALLRAKERLKGDSRFILPDVVEQFSTGKILCTSYEEGFEVDAPEVLSLPIKRRNKIGEAFLELFYQEFFVWKEMQTDPHFGNYRVRVRDAGDQLVLFDYGAVKEFSDEFLEHYYEMVKGSHFKDSKRTIRAAEGLGFLIAEDSDEIRRNFVEFCYLLTEPFADPEDPNWDIDARRRLLDPKGAYDWGASDLPKRAAKQGTQLALQLRLRPPPSEVVFLDRKLTGVFIFLHALKVRIRGKDLLNPFLEA